MLQVCGADKSLQRQLELSSAHQPGAMHPVASAINVAAPDTLKAKQGVAIELLPNLFQLVRKPNNRSCAQSRDRSKRPLVLRPFIRGDKLRLMPGFDHSTRQAF